MARQRTCVQEGQQPPRSSTGAAVPEGKERAAGFRVAERPIGGTSAACVGGMATQGLSSEGPGATTRYGFPFAGRGTGRTLRLTLQPVGHPSLDVRARRCGVSERVLLSAERTNPDRVDHGVFRVMHPSD